jgi:IS5 family transposase
LEVTLRIHLLQQWFTLSDLLMEEMLIDTPCFRRLAEGFAYGMRCHIGVDAASGLVHSVESTAVNVHELNTAAERIHGDERLIYGDAGHIGFEKRDDFQDCQAEFRIAMKPGQHRVLPETPEGRLLDLIETAKAHFRAKVEHPFRVIKCQFDFRKIF